ncbi:MAG: ion channel [Myxococcota bacterium]
MPLRTRVISAGTSYRVSVLDERPLDLRDVSHAMLSLSWPATLGVIVGAWLALNALFAGVFVLTGGVANAAPGSFKDAFFFSVQTMATIGYGAMYPQSDVAEVVVVIESLVGLVVTAIATGVIFVRFSRIRGRVSFSKRVALGVLNGAPHLCVRVGNGRSNRIFDAQFRLLLIRTVVTPEGMTLYQSEDLKLVRDYAPTLQRAWNLMHRIDASSPLAGLGPEQLVAQEAELHVALTGTDETTLQVVHGRHIWEAPDLVFGARLADIVSTDAQGNVTLDLRRFDDVVPTEPTAQFPWPRR